MLEDARKRGSSIMAVLCRQMADTQALGKVCPLSVLSPFLPCLVSQLGGTELLGGSESGDNTLGLLLGPLIALSLLVSVIFKGLQMNCSLAQLFFCFGSWILIFSSGLLHCPLKHLSSQFAAPVFRQPGEKSLQKLSVAV